MKYTNEYLNNKTFTCSEIEYTMKNFKERRCELWKDGKLHDADYPVLIIVDSLEEGTWILIEKEESYEIY